MGIRARLWKAVQDIRASYWFLPTVLVLIGLVLARLMQWIDTNPDMLPFALPDTWIDTQVDGARSTLAVIAQSIIGVTGVMFSMTLVAVSFASGNFGPRLIGNFMRDRGNQWSLGILISTFVYAIVILRGVQAGLDGGVDQFVPQYSLVMAMLLMLACVFTLIFFIHHVPETINVSRISAGLGHRLEQMIRDLIDADEKEPASGAWPAADPSVVITADRSGYIQTVNVSQLDQLAKDHGWHIEMVPDIGDFITCASPVFRVWATEKLEDDDHDSIAGSYALGAGRTENQNPSFVAEQLVEMAARALSPGVNDPYTAQDCLNRLAGALTVASTYNEGLRPTQRGRVRLGQITFQRIFEVSFPLCRHYVRPDPMTRDHALGLLKNLLGVARPDDRPIIQAEIDALSGEA